MKSFICKQCNFEFNYADNATQIQCPNCGYIYTKNINNSMKNVNINKSNEYLNTKRRSSTKKLSPIKLTIAILLLGIIFTNSNYTEQSTVKDNEEDVHTEQSTVEEDENSNYTEQSTVKDNEKDVHTEQSAVEEDENSNFDSEDTEDTKDTEDTVELYDLDKLKAKAKKFKKSAISVTYDDLIHNPDLYECKNIKCKIKFTRTDPDGIIFDGAKLAKISGDSKEICVYDERLLSSPNFCKGDTIVVYGVGAGLGKMKSAGVGGVISDTWRGDKGYSIPCINVYYTNKDNYKDWVTVLNKRIKENGTDSEYAEKGKELADKLNSAISNK